jgi:hypothetical protein
MSETPNENWVVVLRRRFANRDDNGSSRRPGSNTVREASLQKKGRAIRRGNPDRPWGCWEVALRSLARGGYAARTDFPRSLAMAWRSI